MPQLPSVAAAAFVLLLLTTIVVTTVAVRIRSRRRRTLLAAMLRARLPVPRPAISIVEAPLEAVLVPLRRRDYQHAEQQGGFQAFSDRSTTQEGAPGRPGRRLAAQVAYAAPVAAPLPEAASAVAPLVVPTPGLLGAAEGTPPDASQSAGATETGPLPRASEALVPTSLAPLLPAPPATMDEVVARPVPAIEVPPVLESIPDPGPSSLLLTHAGLDAVTVEPVAVEPVVTESLVEPATVEAMVDEEPAPAAAESTPPPPLPASPRQREQMRAPQITALPPRSAMPALPAIMTREVTLGDAARALRATLPAALTMTDGRQLRRAVAVGAATSVVAAAFAIRSRKHR